MLVGREHDIDTLLSLIARPLKQPGSLRVVQVEGPVGIGKSALLSAVAARVAGPVFLSSGERTPGSSPLSSQRSIIEELLKVPLEDALREETIHTLATRCADAMGGVETIWIVDDAQWLSPSAEEFLGSLMQSPKAPPLTVVLTHRTGFSPSSLLSVARRRGAAQEHFRVDPLPVAAMDQLLGDVPPRQASSVREHARGNPLFIQIATAAFKRHPNAATLEEALRFEHKDQSAIVTTAIAEDIASLPTDARSVLETAAVFARLWTVESGAPFLALPPERYRAALSLLNDHGLLTGAASEVMHPVVRLSVYQSISAERRGELHRQAARHDRADVLTRAEHLSQLGHELTEQEAAQVVSGATLMLAIEPASTVRLLASLPPQHRTIDVEKLMARASIMNGHPREAIARLEPLTSGLDNDAELLVLLADALRMIGEAEEARALIQGFPEPDVPLLLREHLDVIALIDGYAPSSLIDTLRAHAGIEHQRVADIYDTMSLLAAGDVVQAREHFRAIPEWIRSLDQESLRDCIHAVACAAWCAYLLDEHPDALLAAERGIAAAQRYGRSSALPNIATARAFALLQLGRIAEAEEAALYALSRSETLGSPDLAAMSRAALLLCVIPQNNREAIAQRYQELVSVPLPNLTWWRFAVVGVRLRASAVLGRAESYKPLLNAPHDALTGMRHADLALAASEENRDDLAEQYLTQGFAVTRRQEADGQEALLYLAQATIALRSKDTRKLRNALDGLMTARGVFVRRQMGLQLGRTDALVAAVRNVLRAAESPWQKLTPREKQVAEQLTQGLTNQQIASHLGISSRTVEDHAARILRKLDAPSRARAAAILSRSESAA